MGDPKAKWGTHVCMEVGEVHLQTIGGTITFPNRCKIRQTGYKKREQLALLSSYMKPCGYFLLLQSLVSLALHQHLLCEHVSAGLR